MLFLDSPAFHKNKCAGRYKNSYIITPHINSYLIIMGIQYHGNNAKQLRVSGQGLLGPVFQVFRRHFTNCLQFKLRLISVKLPSLLASMEFALGVIIPIVLRI